MLIYSIVHDLNLVKRMKKLKYERNIADEGQYRYMVNPSDENAEIFDKCTPVLDRVGSEVKLIKHHFDNPDRKLHTAIIAHIFSRRIFEY